MKKLTRRSFIVGGTAAFAGLASLGISGCSPKADRKETNFAQTGSIEWDEETDVLVIGYGGAGATAAIEASSSGAEVILIDKEAMPGGASSINGGVVLAAGTSVQEAAGFKDDAQSWYDFLKEEIGAGFREDHMERLTEESADVVDWLIGLGVVFPAELRATDTHAIPADGGLYFSDAAAEKMENAVPRGHTAQGGGGAIMQALEDQISQAGITTMQNVAAEKLIQDDSGRVIGVSATKSGQPLNIKANKAVIVSTGHFNLNEDMIKLYMPQVLQLENTSSASHPSATGDGHRMCASIGAALAGMQNGTMSLKSFGPYSIGYETAIRSMMVNKHCQRFWSEAGYHENHRGTALMNQPGQIGFGFIDENIRSSCNEFKPDELTYSADSITELAKLCDLDATALENSINTYNMYCDQGLDCDFGKAPDFLLKIAQPPFYAVKLSYGWMTSGGMSIDGECRVLDVNNKPIEGLYAAGMCANGAYGQLNPASGLNMAWCFYTGKRAGRNAAAETLS